MAGRGKKGACGVGSLEAEDAVLCQLEKTSGIGR